MSGGSTNSLHAVAEASLSSYRANGHKAQIAARQIDDQGITGDVCIVIVEDLRRVEVLLSSASQAAAIRKLVLEADDQGWEVWAIGPLSETGALRTELRGIPALVQPWWVDDPVISPVTVRFGSPVPA